MLLGLGDHGDEKTAGNFGAILLQKVLGRVNQNDLAGIHLIIEFELVLGMGKHPFECLVLQNALESPKDLTFDLGEFLAIKFGGEEGAGRTLQLVYVVLVLGSASFIQELSQRVDGGVWDVQHQTSYVA